MGIELAVRREKFGLAGPTAIGADSLGVCVLAGERRLGSGLTQDVVLLARQRVLPFVLRLCDVVRGAVGPSRAILLWENSQMPHLTSAMKSASARRSP